MAVVSWAGMRGVVSLAAALSLPLSIGRRDLLLFLAVVVIVGTLVAQGLTLPWVIRRLSVEPPDPRLDALQRASAQERATEAAVARLDELVAEEPVPAEVVERLRRLAELRTFIAWERLASRRRRHPQRDVPAPAGRDDPRRARRVGPPAGRRASSTTRCCGKSSNRSISRTR